MNVQHACRKSRWLLRRPLGRAKCQSSSTTRSCSRRAMMSTTSTSTTSSGPSSSSSSSSISQEEIQKFSGMDKNWWDPSFHPLIAMNPVRIRYILDTVKQQQQQQQQQQQSSPTRVVGSPPLEGLQALDVGCGGGLLSESLARLGSHVTALDPSEALVEMAQEHARQSGDPRLLRNIDYRGGLSVEEFAATSRQQSTKEDEKYDIVCLLEVLEHASNVPSLVQAATSLVNDNGGLLFVSTMNRTWKSHLLTIVGAEYIMGYVPKGTHNWNQYLSPEEVRKTMESCGMEQINVSGMVLSKPPICGDWDWHIDPKDTDVNWIGAYRRK